MNRPPLCRDVLAFTLLAGVSLTAGAVTIVHASQQVGASPAPSAEASVMSDSPPGNYSDVNTENAPYPADRAAMPGEWYGFNASQSMLVTLIFESEGDQARLAIAEKSGNSVSTRVYDCKDVLVNNGQFSIGGQGSAVQLSGSAQATWGGAAGAARAMLTIDGPEGRRRAELYFFKARDSSWLDDTLELARRYGLL